MTENEIVFCQNSNKYYFLNRSGMILILEVDGCSQEPICDRICVCVNHAGNDYMRVKQKFAETKLKGDG